MVLAVGDGTTRWLADVGFGSGLLEPMPLRSGVSATQGAWTYQLDQSATGVWTLRERAGNEWITLYGFREETQHFSDVVMSNHYTATWPDSPFVRQAVVVRKDETEVRRLLGSRLSRSRPGRPDDSRELDESQIGPELRRLGVELAPADVAEVITRIRGLELEHAEPG
jgi:N-hydroxyarylamine O-acetyltransferase